MKFVVSLEDKGNATVSFAMESVVSESERASNQVTPASVLALAVKAMFHNGMLAEAGAHALEEAAKGVSPEESIRNKYVTNTNT